MPKYTLYYFKIRGLGETLRWVLAYADADWENVQYTKEDWPQHKEKMPNGQMPVLDVDGKMVPQSAAILRMLAREFGLEGESNADKTMVDVHCENFRDLYNGIKPAVYAMMSNDQATVDSTVEKFKSEVWPKFAEKYEKLVSDGYLVGNKISVADIFLAESLDRLHELYCKGILDTNPAIKAYVAKIKELPTLKKYIDGRLKDPTI